MGKMEDLFKYLLIVAAIGLVLKIIINVIKPVVKGKSGEIRVSSKLRGLPENQYILLNDVMLPTNRGTTQIDHILLSIYGIFVIETKNYKGWIYGNEFSEKWTQNIYGHKKQFMNPLKQNYGHICTLRELLNLPEEKFISIVAFSTDSTLKVKCSKEVVYINRITKTVLKYRTQMFSENEISEMREKILSVRIESNHSNRTDHVKNIKANILEDKEKVKMRICPRCGGQLVDRKGKYGSFLGCSNYPKCRYIKK